MEPRGEDMEWRFAGERVASGDPAGEAKREDKERSGAGEWPAPGDPADERPDDDMELWAARCRRVP